MPSTNTSMGSRELVQEQLSGVDQGRGEALDEDKRIPEELGTVGGSDAASESESVDEPRRSTRQNKGTLPYRFRRDYVLN